MGRQASDVAVAVNIYQLKYHISFTAELNKILYVAIISWENDDNVFFSQIGHDLLLTFWKTHFKAISSFKETIFNKICMVLNF